MACNTNRNCSIEGVFASVASTPCSQFFNPDQFQAEQLIYDTAFKDLINGFGIPVNYYIHTYNLSSADNFYGEHPTSVFRGPLSLMMYIELNENAINLSKFGFASDDELTGFVHIGTFAAAISGTDFFLRTESGDFLTYDELLSSGDIPYLEGGDYIFKNTYISNGQAIEPKSGDLIQVSPLGCDRPNGRGAKIFEITERTDQDVAALNPMLGHYVYRLRAKRYEYSYEPGAPQEPQNQQVFENSFSGKLSSNIPDITFPSESKSYPGNVDQDSKDQVLDMDVNNTDIYGGYY